MARTKKLPLTAERLRELLDYDPNVGRMYWRVSQGSRAVAGTEAGTFHRHSGYVHITIDGRKYRRARLAFLYMTGAWPKLFSDHKNGERDDDRWDNLRDVSRSQNLRNVRPRGRHGLKGVTLRTDKNRNKRWHASICIEGRARSLGDFATGAEAAAAYEAAAKHHHGEFAVSVRPEESADYVSHADGRLGGALADIVIAEIEAGAAEVHAA